MEKGEIISLKFSAHGIQRCWGPPLLQETQLIMQIISFSSMLICNFAHIRFYKFSE